METSMEKGFSALGGLFQSVINDLKVGMPLWEDFLSKAAKLHSQLKATILATSTFLDAFQKIADLATNTRGATKDIGTALTRIIMRHKAVEARLKTFTSSILDCLVLPLQEKMEEWKKTITHLDKEHAKEYKKARQEIKKRSSDTLRLQKKARKGKSDIQRTLDNALQEVTDKFVILEEIEKQAVRTVLIEERSHFCLLVACLKPVVDEEVAMLSEIMHLQEILEQLMKHASDPFTLPQPTEQLINDIKGSENCWSFQTPPSSPSSLGSRKSSICSISSLNSSSSGSTKSHSPSHQLRHRVHAQQQIAIGTLRLSSISSQDSGFTSQDTLFLRPPTPPPLELARQVMTSLETNNSPDTSSSSSTPSPHFPMVPIATATWPNLQETMQFDKTETTSLILAERPHTISSAYERGHQRPALTIHTFQPPDKLPHLTDEYGLANSSYLGDEVTPTAGEAADECPPIPERFVILEKPTVPEKSGMKSSLQHIAVKSPVPDFNQPAPNQIVPQPIYTNLDEIENIREKLEIKSSAVIEQMQKQMPQQAELVAALTQGLQERKVHRSDSEGSTSHVSLLSSSGYGSQSTVATTSDDKLPTEVITEFVFDRSCMDEASKYCTIPRYSDHSQMLAHVAGMKPCTTGHPSVTASQSAHCTIKSSTLRRSNSQTHKPPLPIRRTSSITSQHGLTVVALRNQQAGAATLPRAASTVSDGICRGQLRQLSDNSIDNLVSRKHVFENQGLYLAGKNVENHVSSNKSLSSQVITKKENEEKEKPLRDSSDSQLPGKVANTIKELEEQVTFKSANSVLQEHIVAKINSMINNEQNYSWKNNQSNTGAHNGTRKSSISSQSSTQSDAEIALVNAEVVRNENEGSHPSSPRISCHRPGTPRTTTSNAVASNIPSSSGSGSPRTNSPRMGSLARRMSEPGRFQALDDSIASNRANLIQSLNAKLSGQQEHQSTQAPPATLPKPQRAQSECSQHESFLQNLNAKLAQQIQKQQGPSNAVHSRQQNDKQNFKESLNTKLIQQCRLDSGDAGRVMGRRASVGDAAARVRQWMANRPSVDPATCRESLLDQIRRGASLRKASTNDRSSPRIQ